MKTRKNQRFFVSRKSKISAKIIKFSVLITILTIFTLMFSLNATALVCTCDNDDDCGSGNYCDHGVDCTCPMDDPTCQYVNGRCKACRGEGYSCSSNEQCCNLFCNSGYQISGNYCCPGSQAWDGSRCCRPETITCSSTSQCCSGLQCPDGTRCCPLGYKWSGGQCVDSKDCSSEWPGGGSISGNNACCSRYLYEAWVLIWETITVYPLT